MKTCLLITTFNRGHLLEKSLERLTHLSLPDEILIVDDGSDRHSDATEWVVKGFSQRLPIRYIYNNNPGHSICSYARNIGIKNTDCDIIITSEPELLFVTDIIWQMIKKHKEFPNHVISVGTIYHGQPKSVINDKVLTNPKEFLSESIVEDYQIEPKSYSENGFCKTVGLTATYCALYEKKALLEINGWDEEMPGNYGFDDHLLLTRLRISGYNQVISNEMEGIHIFHEHQLPHIQGKNADMNDKYFQSKTLIDKASPDRIANKNHPWGIIKT